MALGACEVVRDGEAVADEPHEGEGEGEDEGALALAAVAREEER